MTSPDLSQIAIDSIKAFAQKDNLLASPVSGPTERRVFEIFGPAWYKYQVHEAYRPSRVVSDEPTDPEEGFVSIEVLKVLAGKDEPEASRVFYMNYNDHSLSGQIGTDIAKADQSETDQRLLAHLAISLSAVFPLFSNVFSGFSKAP